MYVLNFYSPIFIDQLRRGRKTATIRVGDKSGKYREGEVVMVTVGFQHAPREKIFDAVVDSVEVKRVRELSPRDIEHDNPEFRRHGHGRPLLGDLRAPLRDLRTAAPRGPDAELSRDRVALRGGLALSPPSAKFGTLPGRVPGASNAIPTEVR
jgi:hypothetical protein